MHVSSRGHAVRGRLVPWPVVRIVQFFLITICLSSFGWGLSKGSLSMHAYSAIRTPVSSHIFYNDNFSKVYELRGTGEDPYVSKLRFDSSLRTSE